MLNSRVESVEPMLAGLASSLQAVADRIAAGDVLEMTAPEFSDVVRLQARDVVAAVERLLAAVQRSHALEAAVHELFEAMSSHLRLDYLSYEALYRVIDHTGACGGALVLAG